jgi:cell division protein FtsZ
MESSIKFNMPRERSSIIKVIGVGGGGGNAVNYMFSQGIKGVDFIICNTDLQVLEASPIANKIQLGASLTNGLGAGANPEVGKQSAMEAVEDIIETLGVNTKMLFITAGMGGGTGTGAAPIIAKIARDLDILTVGIVTTPFSFEGKKRISFAEEGIEALKKSVDCLLVINNNKIKEMYGNLPMSQAFSQANEILNTAAKGIAEVITYPGEINVDFEDVKTVMKSSGVALMGSATASGQDRAIEAVKAALNSPLLNDNKILGAKNILLNISSAKGAHELLMDEFEAISNYIQEESGNKAEMIIGTSYDENLGESIAITLVATGFESGKYENKLIEIEPVQAAQKPIVMPLINEVDAPVSIPNSVDEAVIDTPQDQDISLLAPETIVEDAPVEQINHFLFEAELTEEFNAEASIEFEINPQSNENITNELINESEIDFQDNADLSEIPQEQLVNPVTFSQDDLPLPQAPNAAADKKDFFIQPSLLDFHEDPFFEEAERKIEKQISRIKELKELNLNIHSSQGLRDLEKEPAYKRRQKRLDEIPHSSASQVSRLSLFEDGSGKPELKSNNSFLHDNVD